MDEFARYPSLEGRVVFITGGGSGIGASMVEHFCAQGSSVAFVDIKVEKSLALAAGIEGAGGPKPLFIPCDLLDIEALRRAVAQTADELGPIGALVNNAAEDTRHDVEEVTVEYWDGRMAVNLRHQFFAAQAVVGQMKAAGGGSIINFGSISWIMGEGGMPGYTTAKAAVHGLTRGLARDFGADNIRVNTISPGWVMTERQIEMWLDEAAEMRIAERQCLREKLYPPDIARMVLFLAADDSRMCTAQNFIVDAGWV